jgi:hypothetical protein
VYEDGFKVQGDKTAGDKTTGDKDAGSTAGGGAAGGATGGIAGKVYEDGFKVQGDKTAGDKAMGDKDGGLMGELDKFKFGEGFEDFGGDKLGGDKLGDKLGGEDLGLGDKLAGFGDKTGGVGMDGKDGKFKPSGESDGSGVGLKKEGKSYTDGVGKKDPKTGDSGGGTGDAGWGKKDKTDSAGGTQKDTKTDSTDKTKSETKTSDDGSGKTEAKETGGKEKEKKDTKGAGGIGPGDPDKTDQGGGGRDPLGLLGVSDRERNPMPTGEEVGINRGEGDRGHATTNVDTELSRNARIQPSEGDDYLTRDEGPSLLWQMQHYGVDPPETSAVQGQALGTAAARMHEEGAAGQVEEIPEGMEPPPGAGD